LQKMCKSLFPDYIADFLEWLQSTEKEHWLGSMEQLWLAFIMSEKYGKVWNGDDWVKETKS